MSEVVEVIRRPIAPINLIPSCAAASNLATAASWWDTSNNYMRPTMLTWAVMDSATSTTSSAPANTGYLRLGRKFGVRLRFYATLVTGTTSVTGKVCVAAWPASGGANDDSGVPYILGRANTEAKPEGVVLYVGTVVYEITAGLVRAVHPQDGVTALACYVGRSFTGSTGNPGLMTENFEAAADAGQAAYLELADTSEWSVMGVQFIDNGATDAHLATQHCVAQLI